MFNRASDPTAVPFQPWRGTSIPRIIHQTFARKSLPEELRLNVEYIKEQNPGWSYRFYDDDAVNAFILQEYGERIFQYFNRIDSSYGAARADLFRYLLIYKVGGVYLDIKSRFTRPIDEVLTGDEGFIISQWSNMPGQRYEGYGIHEDVSMFPGGEIQQWHVIGAPGHPFLKNVLDQLFLNIDSYRPWKDGTGKLTVLRSTGPILYTRIINPIMKSYPSKIVRNEEELCLDYSVASPGAHHKMFDHHYSYNRAPLVRQEGLNHFISWAWRSARALKVRAKHYIMRES